MSSPLSMNDPADHMFTSHKNISQGNREFNNLSKNCTTSMKVGAFFGGMIGGAIATAIPPPGVATLGGVAVGGAIGAVIGGLLDGDKKKEHRE